MKFNVYVDGSWLFKQCGTNGVFASRMEYPENAFRLDFSKLVGSLSTTLSQAVGQPTEVAELYFYTAVFEIPEAPNPEWGDLSWIRNSTHARQRFADAALGAGFLGEGVFKVPLRTWIIDKLQDRRYQEKMVDTSLVARLVEQSIKDPDRLHVLISGDLDMLPAIKTVVPEYTETVVLATTHPDQYYASDAQSSFRLNTFDFRYEPIYLERHVADFVSGEHVYECSNTRCHRLFVRAAPIPRGANPRCKPCSERRAR